MKNKIILCILSMIIAFSLVGCGLELEREAEVRTITTRETLPLNKEQQMINPSTHLPLEDHPAWENFKFKIDRVEYSFPFDYTKLEYPYGKSDKDTHPLWFQHNNMNSDITHVKAKQYQSVKYYTTQYGTGENSMYIELIFKNKSDIDQPLSNCIVETVFLCGFNKDESKDNKEYEEPANVPMVDLQQGKDSIGFGTRDYTIIKAFGEPHVKENVDANLNKWVYFSKDSTMTFYFLDGFGVCGIRLDHVNNSK